MGLTNTFLGKIFSGSSGSVQGLGFISFFHNGHFGNRKLDQPRSRELFLVF